MRATYAEKEMGAATRPEQGMGGTGSVGTLLLAVMAASASVSIATRMSSISGPDLRLKRWTRERRVAVSPAVAVATAGLFVRRAVGMSGAANLGGALSW